jgi:uncharacterized membrane protein YgcG
MNEIFLIILLIVFFIGWALGMNYLRGRIKPDRSSRDDSPGDLGSGDSSYDGGHGGGFDGFGGGESGGGGASGDGH